MKTQETHIIQSLKVDFETNSMQVAEEIKEKSKQWVQDLISDALSDYFAKMERQLKGQIIQFESIDLELDVNSFDENSMTLKNEIITKLEDSISAKIRQTKNHKNVSFETSNLNFDNVSEYAKIESDKSLSKDERILRSFIYFLESGQKPWWVNSNEELTLLLNGELLIQVIRKNPMVFAGAIKSKTKNATFFERLCGQFNSKLIWEIICVLNKALKNNEMEKSKFSNEIFSELISNKQIIKVQIINLLIHSILFRTASNQFQFEYKLFQELCQHPQIIYKTNLVSSAEIFKTVATISALTSNQESKFKSYSNLQNFVAKQISPKLSQSELSSIISSAPNTDLSKETIELFKIQLIQKAQNSSQHQNEIKQQIEHDLKTKISAEKVADSPDLKENLEPSSDAKAANSKLNSDELRGEQQLDNHLYSNDEILHNTITQDTIPQDTIHRDTILQDTLLTTEKNAELKEEKTDSNKEFGTRNDSNSEKLIESTLQNENRKRNEELNQNFGEPKSETQTNISQNALKSDFKSDVDDIINKNEFENETDESVEKDPIKLKTSSESNEFSLINEVKAGNSSSDIERSAANNEVKDLILALNREKEEASSSNQLISEQEFFTENGGLVLLHPFLGQLFKKLELIDENNFILDKARAITILHYLATGKQQVFEHHLHFEKYLCGMSVNSTVSKEIELTEVEINEAKNVLSSVNEHWKKMNNSSIELLQNEFLKRQCKIFRGDKTDRIKMEKKPFDLLMDSLPWSINMVKLPWKKELIFVEW